MENGENKLQGIKRSEKREWMLTGISILFALIGCLTGLRNHGVVMELLFCLAGLALIALCALGLHDLYRYGGLNDRITRGRMLHAVILHTVFTCMALITVPIGTVCYTVMLALADGALAVVLVFVAGMRRQGIARILGLAVGVLLGLACAACSFFGVTTILCLLLIIAAMAAGYCTFRSSAGIVARIAETGLATVTLILSVVLLFSYLPWVHMLLHALFLMGSAVLVVGGFVDRKTWLEYRGARRSGKTVVYTNSRSSADVSEDAEIEALLDKLMDDLTAEIAGDADEQETTKAFDDENDTAGPILQTDVAGAVADAIPRTNEADMALRTSATEEARSMNLYGIVHEAYRNRSMRELAKAPLTAFSGVSEQAAQNLKDAFGVDNIGELGELKFAKWAQNIQIMAAKEE